MHGVTREQIDRAKAVKIEDYLLANEPQNVKRIGSAYYLKDHESLEVSNGLWNWHSRGFGGKNVVDFLMKVRGFDFVSAVKHLACDYANYAEIIPNARPPNERQAFVLPPKNADNMRVMSYLQSRGIALDVIRDCINRGILYESAKWHNCIFVGRDERGKAKSAAMRGTMGDFKRDADGSDKRFAFVLPPENGSNSVAIFESAIDCMSHKSAIKSDVWRLSLGGTALIGLEHFLDKNLEIKHVIVCTDNDAAGDACAAKIAEIPGLSVTRSLPPDGAKDWNEYLQIAKKEVNFLNKIETLKHKSAQTKTPEKRGRTPKNNEIGGIL